jgi:hypothetical protein
MSALIGLAIMGIWLVVLVPMWLNRHEADDASRSMDSFSTAMRVLSRRPAHSSRTSNRGGDRRYVVMPRRDDWGVTVDNNPDAKIGRRPLARRPVPATTSAVRQGRLIARRRRIMLVVLSLVVVLAITAAIGVTSWWYELAVGLAAAGFVIHLRNEAIRARDLRRRRAARLARAAMVHEPLDEPAFRRPAPAVPFVSDDEVLPPLPVSAAGTENGSRWEPVPVPLPTYVSKPVVSRPAAMARAADVDATREQTIDLTRPGAWTDEQVDHRHLLLDETGSGRIAASAGAPPVRNGGLYDQDEDELDLILQRRRAVGD